MNAEQNDRITRIGPGTPCGALLRRYWQPAALVDEFDPAIDPRMEGRAVKAVRLLGEELVLFRDAAGTWGLVARNCPHRGADLAFGRLEEDGLLRVFRSNSPPWLAFHAAEICGKARRLSSRELGDLCLRASWVCRKERERPFESTFQLRAVRHFMRSLQEEDLIGRELAVTTYLVGELNRRLGNHREALNWYVNAGRTTEGDPRVAWLDRLIDRQRKLAEEQAA